LTEIANAKGGFLFLSALPQEGEVLEGMGLLTEVIEGDTPHPHEVGLFEQVPLIYATTGIGKVNAAIVSAHLIASYQPKLVLFFGLAGGLDSSLSPGQLTLVEKCWQHDYGAVTPQGFVRWQAGEIPIGNPVPPRPLIVSSEIKSLLAGTFDEPWVNLATGDVFIESNNYRQELIDLGAQIVDMEGAPVAQAAELYSKPWVIVRQISDAANDDAGADFDGRFTQICKDATPEILRIMGALKAI